MLLHFIVTCLIALITLIKEKKMLANNGFEKFEFWWITHDLIQTPYTIIFAVDVFVPDLINNCLPILGSILERGARGWHVQYRQKMMRDLQGQWSYWLHTCIYISSQQGLDPVIWSMYCCQSPIIRSKEMWNVKFDQMMRAWQQDIWSSSWYSVLKNHFIGTRLKCM